jgi:D-arabinose 1-dehydrogenase-like Zn-dependent alcohol dehydrogenase
VVRLAEQGRIRVDVDVYDFDQVESALDDLRQGRLRGRAVVKIA